MPTLFRRLRYFFRRRRADEEVAEELQFHREMVQAELEREGLARAEAATAARRAVGNVTLAREDARAVWIAPWIESLLSDFRHGVRSLARSPALVVVSALSLGLGFGVNAVLYMGLSTVFGHEPTMAEPERLVGVEPGNANQFSYPDYQDLLRSRIFADAIGFRTIGLNLGSGDDIRPVSALAVTANFFDVLGVTPLSGRTFSPADAAPEHEPREVVVTFDFWRTALHAARDLSGASLVLNGERFAVVGVLPERYHSIAGWISPDLYVPLSRLTLATLEERGSPSLSVVGRLAPGSTAAQAQLAVAALDESLERAFPDRIERRRPASVFPARAIQFRGIEMQFRLFRTLTWITVSLVMLIACVNVTGLLMARATHRRREISVRVAIGAGRARLVQTMLIESFLLVSAGAIAGLLLALAVNRIPFPGGMGMVQDILTPDARVLPNTIALVVVLTLVCGVIPAIRVTRPDLVAEVRQSGDGATPRMWLRQVLVAGQVAMSLVLTVGTLLCVRSQTLISRMDLGFDVDHGVVARFSLDPSQYPGEERLRFVDRIVERVAQVPGVSAASPANLVPLGGDVLVRSFHPAGRTDIPGTRPSTFSVGPGYFRTLAIPFLKGIDFDDTHTAGTPPVAIVNETFAKTHFPGQEIIGRRVQTADEPEAQVIGLVRDNRIGTIGEAPQSVIYYAFAQRPRNVIVHARTGLSPDVLVPVVRKAIDEIDPSVPVSVQTLRRATSTEWNMRRVGTALMGTMGGLGLVLAMIGLYGVMLYVAASRTTEVGVRMALGASRGRIRRESLQQALKVIGPGVAAGVIGAAALMPALSTFLAGVSPFDPIAFAGAAMLLTIAGLIASYLPAHKTSRIDPLRALRQS